MGGGGRWDRELVMHQHCCCLRSCSQGHEAQERWRDGQVVGLLGLAIDVARSHTANSSWQILHEDTAMVNGRNWPIALVTMPGIGIKNKFDSLVQTPKFKRASPRFLLPC